MNAAQTPSEETPPPIGKTWKRIYLYTLIFLGAQIALYSWISKLFST